MSEQRLSKPESERTALCSMCGQPVKLLPAPSRCWFVEEHAKQGILCVSSGSRLDRGNGRRGRSPAVP